MMWLRKEVRKGEDWLFEGRVEGSLDGRSQGDGGGERSKGDR